MLGLGNSITSGAALEEFDITTISSLQAWFKKGEGITTDGGNVSIWTSQVGDLSWRQTNSATQPVHDASTDVIQFTNGRQLSLNNAAGTSSASVTGGTDNAITVCLAMKVNVDNTNGNTQFQHILGSGNNTRITMYLDGDFFYLAGSSATITMVLPDTTLTNNEIALMTWINEGGTNGNARILKNTSTTQLNDPDTGTTGAISISQFGNDGAAGGRGFSGGAIELAIFNEELTGNDLQNVLTDIATRAGI